jgi:tetratricopeptide (TPR) repeat protein
MLRAALAPVLTDVWRFPPRVGPAREASVKSYSFVKWFFFALLYPMHPAAMAQQPEIPSFRFSEADVRNVDRLPPARKDGLTLSHSIPPPAVRAPALRFGLKPTLEITDVPFEDENAPVSANLLKVPRKAQGELEKGIKAAMDRQLSKAEEHLLKSLEHYPEFSAAYHNLGVVKLLRGDVAGAESLMEKALTFDQRSPYSLMALAQLRFRDGDLAAADRYLERVLALYPRNLQALTFRALVQIHLGQTNAALKTYSKLEEQDHSRLPVFHLLAGSTHELRGDHARAISEYTKYLRESPEAGDAVQIKAAINELQATVARK